MIKNIFTLITILFSIVIVISSSCYKNNNLDNGLINVNTSFGVKELHPVIFPIEVVFDKNFECKNELIHIINNINKQFNKNIIFTINYSDARFDFVKHKFFVGEYEYLKGVILVDENFNVSVDNYNSSEIGALTTLIWDQYGGIYISNITINEMHSYNCKYLYPIFMHELGHCLGLADDEKSLDLNSCMSDNTQRGCKFLESDIELVNKYYNFIPNVE